RGAASNAPASRAGTAPGAPAARTGSTGTARGRRSEVDEEAPARPLRRTRVVPAVPRQRLGPDGRVLTESTTAPAEPEPRPAAFLKETIRTRQVVRHVETWSVLRVSFLFYLLAMVVTLLAGVALWNVASALGTITSIDKSIKTLFDLKTFTLRPLPVLSYSAAGAAALVVVGTLVNTMVAVVFNLISDVTGGVAVRIVAQPDDE
ncbi:MAG: DUF3566 domain-containing protein, partial [Actinomycetota bacterium]|nr:DUF3566 domain-containing protein [Actinomycetota bacterium]